MNRIAPAETGTLSTKKVLLSFAVEGLGQGVVQVSGQVSPISCGLTRL